MSFGDKFHLVDALKNVINPRKEDGHGSAGDNPSFSLLVDTGYAPVDPRKEDGHGSVESQPSFVRLVGSTLVPEKYDGVELAYTGDNLTSVTYKLGVSTIATLTLSYTDGKLTGVARS